MKKPPAVTDIGSLPVVLTIQDIAGIYRISYATIRRGLLDGTFTPRPWGRSPVRWTRDDVIADLKRRRDEGPGPRGGRRLVAKAPLLTPRRAPRRAAS